MSEENSSDDIPCCKTPLSGDDMKWQGDCEPYMFAEGQE